MGFGLLLMGYFCVNVMALYPPLSFAMLIGYGLMIVALFRLAPYHKCFYQCRNFSFAALPFAGYYTAFGLAAARVLPEMPIFSSAFDVAVDWAYFAYGFLLQAWLLWAILKLTLELEVVKLQTTALRNLIFMTLYHIVYPVAKLPLSFIQNNIGLLAVPVTLLRLIVVFCNLWLFYSCYRAILPEGSDVTTQLPDLLGNINRKEK